MRRLASKTVFSGLRATWFLAASPIRRSLSVKATYEGVVRFPWSLAIISTPSFFHTPTHEYVVPRSMPTADFLAIAGKSWAGSVPVQYHALLSQAYLKIL